MAVGPTRRQGSSVGSGERLPVGCLDHDPGPDSSGGAGVVEQSAGGGADRRADELPGAQADGGTRRVRRRLGEIDGGP